MRKKRIIFVINIHFQQGVWYNLTIIPNRRNGSLEEALSAGRMISDKSRFRQKYY